MLLCVAPYARGHFINVGLANKLMYLALRKASSKWTAPMLHWNIVLQKLMNGDMRRSMVLRQSPKQIVYKTEATSILVVNGRVSIETECGTKQENLQAF